MRTIILFIINLLVGVWCGLHSANAAPLPGMPVADVHSKSAAEEVGWRQQWYRGYVSSALRILPACLYLLSSSAPVYYAPAYPAYPYYRPYGYYRPYYAPY